ncbi:unnamed protein product, partial [Oikopleura dioica]
INRKNKIAEAKAEQSDANKEEDMLEAERQKKLAVFKGNKNVNFFPKIIKTKAQMEEAQPELKPLPSSSSEDEAPVRRPLRPRTKKITYPK